MPKSLVVCYITAPTRAVAEALAQSLVGTHRVAACVNIIPNITSVYRWDGEVKTDEEVLMLVKTQSQLVSQLSSIVQQEHPYDVPEVVAVPIQGGLLPYLQWVEQSTTSSPPQPATVEPQQTGDLSASVETDARRQADEQARLMEETFSQPLK